MMERLWNDRKIIGTPVLKLNIELQHKVCSDFGATIYDYNNSDLDSTE